ncbi:unnamed protein product [Zymoseptoria tritici ST99CH_1A5]|uniref:Uncharacterized protein n=1 Tax=Zymoseptoria tritici ST99CH_1A5 TaxID=1276529 RepID=A0A1Y6LBQ3_ZYMTR|nr:unnamed protein product [Zymoseptoria tritici ST99CH_1A5]
MSEDGNSEYDLNTSSDEDSDQDFGEDEADGLAADGSIAGEILINDYWNPDDYDAIDLDQVKKPDPVDADDVARFQERVRDGVDAGEGEFVAKPSFELLAMVITMGMRSDMHSGTRSAPERGVESHIG